MTENFHTKQGQRVPIHVTAEQKVLPYIIDFYRSFKMMPTLKEIASAHNRSYEWARQCLMALKKSKKIKMKHGSRRGIQLI